MTKVLSFTIVALPYYDVGECLDEFFSEAGGRMLTLRPDPDNEHYNQPVRVYDWRGRHVGFVSREDKQMAEAAIKGSGRRQLKARVSEVHPDHNYLIVECAVQDVPVVSEESHGCFDEWTYTGPVMKLAEELKREDYLADELDDRMLDAANWTEDDVMEFRELADQYCHYVKFDLSADAVGKLRELRYKMRRLECGLDDVEERLACASGYAGRECNGGEVLEFWTERLPHSEEVAGWLACRGRDVYDVEAVRSCLASFPHGVYQTWQQAPKQIVAKLLYMDVPRQKLWQFVSGLVFVSLCDRADSLTGAQLVSDVVTTTLSINNQDYNCKMAYVLRRVDEHYGGIYHDEIQRLEEKSDEAGGRTTELLETIASQQQEGNEVMKKAANRKSIGQLVMEQNNYGVKPELEATEDEETKLIEQ